jgi:predicted outer membrane protein
MQNVAILLPTSFDEAYSRQEQADMKQHREATTRRTQGGLLK